MKKKISEKQKARIEEIGNTIIEAFREGRIPKALAKIFLHQDPHSQVPSYHWSFLNRLTMVLWGHTYAAGFRQWQKLGRAVREGEKAFYIQRPMKRKAREDDEALGVKEGDTIVFGFKLVPVFGYDQTDGEPIPGSEEEARFLDSLPLVEVARAWGLKLLTFSGPNSRQLGYYEENQAIGVGVENLSVWAHELVHAADHRRGTLVKSWGQELTNEVVAQLGSCILLEALGYDAESDRGFTFDYIETYCQRHEADLLATCTALVDRTCQAVQLLLDTARELQAQAA